METKKNLSGKVSANTFGSKIFLEGPVSKGKSSFIVSAKNSYLNKTSNYIYKDLFFSLMTKDYHIATLICMEN